MKINMRIIKDSICASRGHARMCSHGKPFFECGPCHTSRERIGDGISSLANVKVNQKGNVASIHTHDYKKLQKCMAMNILPGMEITLIQNFPSYVFQIGQSQFAIDKELAESIFVCTKNARTL